MSRDPSTTEQITAAVLAVERCRDVHGAFSTSDPCESCASWAAHVAQQIAARLDDGLRAGIEALADEWESLANDPVPSSDIWSHGYADGKRSCATRIRTLLDQTRTEADR